MEDVMKIANQLGTMFSLQDELNKVVDHNWMELNRPWYRAVWTECEEIMDHLVWKWWKKPNPDMEQAKMELVDIWHFGMSDMMTKYGLDEDLIIKAHKTVANAQLTYVKKDNEDLLSAVEEFAADTIKNKGFDLFCFTILLCKFDMTIDELYFQYVGKNILNKFRQDNGYKDGTYSKIWEGKEDNLHLSEILNDLRVADVVINLEAVLYAVLDKRYTDALTKEVPL